MLSLSLKFEIDNGAYPPIFIPERFAWSNYTQIFQANDFFRYFLNSVIVTGTATLLALVVGVPAGYGMARMKAKTSAIIVMIARMTPGLSFLIPLFLVFSGRTFSAPCGRRSSSTSSSPCRSSSGS